MKTPNKMIICQLPNKTLIPVTCCFDCMKCSLRFDCYSQTLPLYTQAVLRDSGAYKGMKKVRLQSSKQKRIYLQAILDNFPIIRNMDTTRNIYKIWP